MVLCDEIPVRFASTIPPLVLHDVVNATGSGVGSGPVRALFRPVPFRSV